MGGKALRQRGSQLSPAARPLGDELPGERKHGVDVYSAEVAITGQLSVQHGLHERSHREAVLGRDEVDGRAHERDPDDPALLQ